MRMMVIIVEVGVTHLLSAMHVLKSVFQYSILLVVIELANLNGRLLQDPPFIQFEPQMIFDLALNYRPKESISNDVLRAPLDRY